MAVIRCSPGAGGTLIPITVEFEAGDVVEFQSGDCATEVSFFALEVRGILSLDNLSSDQGKLMIRIDRTGSAVPARTLKEPDPRLPPPPPEDGALKFTPGRGAGNPIKVVIEAAST